MKLWSTILAGLVVCGSLANVATAQARDGTDRAANPPPAPLDILIVGSHPDDEAIGCTTLIRRAIKAGKRVGIVMINNGDGFPRAAAAVTKKPQDQLVPADFMKLSGVRQQHVVTAMTQIGVKAEDLISLGYPDGGLPQIYATEGPVPFRQKHTQKNETYGVVLPDYHSQVHGRPAPYIKASVVSDLAEIIKARKPKEIYVLHDAVGHSDHRAALWFLRDAVQAAEWRGALFAYFVGDRFMLPPPMVRLMLTEEEFAQKKATLELYQAHMAPVHTDLAERFTTREERFWPIPISADPEPADDGKLRIISLGAHPDDCEIKVGGSAALWSDRGHHVKFVSATNGDLGHWGMIGERLAKRRAKEVQAVAKILGTTTQVLDIPDGQLMPTLENRHAITRLIRDWKADVVIGHRPNDYHPDHRYVGVLMQDSAFMVQVPYACNETAPLEENPVFLFFQDRFQRPNPFRADVVVAIDDVIERKLDALLKLKTQFVEGGCLGVRTTWRQMTDKANREEAARQSREKFRARFAAVADKYRDKLIELYGEQKGRQVQYAEAFEVCEYGRQPTKKELLELFPSVPK